MDTKYYKSLMFKYGILTVIFILEYLEKEEYYEECATIMSAIKENSKYLNFKFPTKYSEETMKTVIETYKNFGLTGRNAEINSREYSLEIIPNILNEIND